ncbi:MAG: hypothetical protein E5W74_14415 [Mesorhizobium sp.]|uniref:plasmid partitioning protein RepB C-terminal domain-containing protein n=1 Tax=Mesorhizobium sp. TaxID=1871066 RepID=UPI001221DC03|nr:plasmid partitioning protein RepB C-terminal domain-containing protein [Mesorhizobium sp.]TIT11042.1 MAG: hypothetical protein E5W74_14415 [Mesorhizobium sp.]
MDKSAAAHDPPTARRRGRAAQYLRMSTDQQIYSLENQKDAIRSYAGIMGYDIVATYEDPGRSGLSLQGRPGLQKLLFDVENGFADFETVVVYDVSRWGRFQNVDESASYEYRCQSAGVRIEFCAEQFANDGTMGSDVLKAIKRTMAAEYSRMLSQRCFIGQSRIVQMGFRVGGPPGYGFRRLLVDQSGEPKGILKRKEWKSLVSDRVVRVLGPPEELETVRWIFDQFVNEGKTKREIANALNARGMVTDHGRPWSIRSVKTVLTHEKYIGNVIWNRSSSRLTSQRTRNPASVWIRVENASAPIVSPELFDRAQVEAKARLFRMTDNQMLAPLAKLLKRKGALSERIINAARGCPSSSQLKRRFRTLAEVYRRIGYQPPRNYDYIGINVDLRGRRQEVIEELVAAIEDAGGSARYDPDSKLVTVNGEFTVAIWIARCRLSRHGYPRWAFRRRRFAGADLSVLIRMQPDDTAIRDFLVLPGHEANHVFHLLKAENGCPIDSFVFATLDILVAMARRAPDQIIPPTMRQLHRGIAGTGRHFAGLKHAPEPSNPLRGYVLLRNFIHERMRMRHFVTTTNELRKHWDRTAQAMRQLMTVKAFRELLKSEGIETMPSMLMETIPPSHLALMRAERPLAACQIEGICADALGLLENCPVPSIIFSYLREVSFGRQIEMSKIMLALGSVRADFAKTLVALTPRSQLADPSSRRKRFHGIKAAQVTSMEAEFGEVSHEFLNAVATHGVRALGLVAAHGYLGRILENPKVVRYLARDFPIQFAQFQWLLQIR